MALIQDQFVFQCTKCLGKLDLESKILPCLHSFCRSCMDKYFEGGETDGNGLCPECNERRQLESTDLKCDLCSDDGIESIARNWCHNCQKIFCANCSRFHKKFHPQHIARDLDGMEREDVIKLMTTDMCCLHKKEKDSYCVRCNVWFCDTCYQKHQLNSPGCSSRPLAERDEACKQKLQGPTLAKGMDDLQIGLKRLNDKVRSHTDGLNSSCDSKCNEIWENYKEMIENARRKTKESCYTVRRTTDKQVERWRQFVTNNETILEYNLDKPGYATDS